MIHRTISAITLLAGLVIGIAGCTATPTFQAGDDAEVTHDGLTRLDRTIMDAVWARQDADISGVSKIKLQGIGVEYRNVTGPYSGRAGAGSSRRTSSSEFQLDADTRALFEEEIRGVFVDELSKSKVFQIVEESGPDVLLVRAGLLDVVSRVPPENLGRGNVFIDQVGEATLVLEVRDSQSNTAIARAVDRRAASGTNMTESNSVQNRAEVRRLGRRWGALLREGLEKMIADGLSG
jgi:hypothetical protein